MPEESFTRNWRGWAVSSLGYRVRVMGRNDLQYEDEFGRQHLFVEPEGESGSDIVVDTQAIVDRPERSRDEIADRLRRAFVNRGWNFIEGGTDR